MEHRRTAACESALDRADSTQFNSSQVFSHWDTQKQSLETDVKAARYLASPANSMAPPIDQNRFNLTQGRPIHQMVQELGDEENAGSQSGSKSSQRRQIL